MVALRSVRSIKIESFTRLIKLSNFEWSLISLISSKIRSRAKFLSKSRSNQNAWVGCSFCNVYQHLKKGFTWCRWDCYYQHPKKVEIFTFHGAGGIAFICFFREIFPKILWRSCGTFLIALALCRMATSPTILATRTLRTF